jgi:hypothetical protein
MHDAPSHHHRVPPLLYVPTFAGFFRTYSSLSPNLVIVHGKSCPTVSRFETRYVGKTPGHLWASSLKHHLDYVTLLYLRLHMWTYLGLGTVQGHVSQYHRTTGRFNGLVSGTVPFVIRNEPANPFYEAAVFPRGFIPVLHMDRGR